VTTSSDLLPPDWDSWSVERQRMFLDEIKYNWRLWARPEQLAPDDEEWDILFLMCGRGFGKTRSGAEYVREQCTSRPGIRAGMIGQTVGAVRDIMIEGESGILGVTPSNEIAKYNRSLGQVHFKNGSICYSFSGNDPEKLRGFQSHTLWMDELAAWNYERETFDQAVMGLRLGVHPRIVITTTPKPSPLVVELLERSRLDPRRVRLVTGSTFDNAANLPESTLASLRARYEGTTLGRQELYAEVILDDPRALWKREQLDTDRIDASAFNVNNMAQIVVAVDPSMSEGGQRATETGIIVVGRGHDGHGYLIADCSILRPSPDTWARQVIAVYHQYRADKVVAEVNQGYDLVKHVLATVDPSVPIKKVYSRRGKDLRAQPVAALAEQHRIHHVGHFVDLEDQLTQWVPGTGQASPDRLDAYVHGFTEVMLGGGVAEMFAPSSLPNLPGTVRSAGRPRR
jgi:phage terminase large subunit-like protein